MDLHGLKRNCSVSPKKNFENAHVPNGIRPRAVANSKASAASGNMKWVLPGPLRRVVQLLFASHCPPSELVSAMQNVTCQHLGVDVHHTKHLDEICFYRLLEKQNRAITIFSLPPGSELPFHDHPGMHVTTKLLSGKMSCLSFDRPPLLPTSVPAGTLFKASGAVKLFEMSSGDIAQLGPECGNIHRFVNNSQSNCAAVFVDVFHGYYDDATPCNYYEMMKQGAEDRAPLTAPTIRCIPQPPIRMLHPKYSGPHFVREDEDSG